MKAIDYLKLMNRRDIVNVFVGILCAYCGISFVFTNYKFDQWTLQHFDGKITLKPTRCGRSGLVVTVSVPDDNGNALDKKIYFNEAGYPRHPLNQLRAGDKVYVEALFNPTQETLESAVGVHLACNARTLFSREHYFEKQREGKVWAIIIGIAPLCWLLYQINKHYFHYRHLKKKKRFNESLPA